MIFIHNIILYYNKIVKKIITAVSTFFEWDPKFNFNNLITNEIKFIMR